MQNPEGIDLFKISAEAMYEKILIKEHFTIVDVRSPILVNPNDYSIEEGYDFLNIPYVDFQDNLQAALEKLPKNDTLIFMCRSGRKTRIVMEILKDEPLDMLWVEGGLNAWRNFYQTRPVLESDSGSIYQISRPGRGDLSYVIISNGEAAVIDVMRGIEHYIDFIKSKQARLISIFDSHNHADRISGGRFLSQATAAPYYKHPYDAIHLIDRLPMAAPYQPLWDGDHFQVGAFSIDTIWFPGHTLGMSNFLLTTPENKTFLFTGDGIFINSIGRPDLMGVGTSWAHLLYTSLQNRLDSSITDDTILLPAHFQLFNEQEGDGLYQRSYGRLKQENPMLRPMTEKAFTDLVLRDIPVAPEEYIEILRINHALLEVDEERASELESGKNLCSATIEILN